MLCCAQGDSVEARLLRDWSCFYFFGADRTGWVRGMLRCYDKPEGFAEAATQQHGEGGPAIFPGVELFLYARRVADGHFNDLVACLEDAGGDLWFDLETAAFHGERAG